MKTTIISVAIALIFWLPCFAAVDSDLPNSNVLYCKIVDPIANAAVKKLTIPPKGTVIAVYQHGQTCYYNFGQLSSLGVPPDERSIFQISSLTKTFTATILALKQISGLNVKSSVTNQAAKIGIQLQPNFKAVNYFQLATFTSGLPDMPNLNINLGYPLAFQVYQQSDFVNFLNSFPGPKQGLPSPYGYSNVSYGFLGQLLMSMDGYTDFTNAKQFDLWINRNINKDLLMYCTSADPNNMAGRCNPDINLAQGYQYDPHSNAHLKVAALPWVPFAAAASLYSRAIDLVIYARAYLGETEIDGVKIPPQLTKAMKLARTPTDIRINNSVPDLQAYAWIVKPRTANLYPQNIVMQSGSVAGFTSCIYLNPDRSLAVIVLMNTRQPTGTECVANDYILQGIPNVYTAMIKLPSESSSTVLINDMQNETLWELDSYQPKRLIAIPAGSSVRFVSGDTNNSCKVSVSENGVWSRSQCSGGLPLPESKNGGTIVVPQGF